MENMVFLLYMYTVVLFIKNLDVQRVNMTLFVSLHTGYLRLMAASPQLT